MNRRTDNSLRPRRTRWRGGLRLGAVLCVAAWMTACSGPSKGPAPAHRDARLEAARTEADVLAHMGRPTARYALAGGITRLEFARGPAGYETWMVDLAPDGRVLRHEQVLTRVRFGDVRLNMNRDELLHLLGRPAARQREYTNRESWYWRFDPYECHWWAVTLSPQGRVIHTGSLHPDPLCDVSQ